VLYPPLSKSIKPYNLMVLMYVYKLQLIMNNDQEAQK
jgi:hypothetical protein